MRESRWLSAKIGLVGLNVKLSKVLAISAASILVLAALGLAAIYVRLIQGPVPLDFLQGRIEKAINAELPDMAVKLGAAVLEIDSVSGIPSVRFNNIILLNKAGATLATSPQAGVTLDKYGLLLGRVTVKSLQLIGPKISARRNLDGSVTLGMNGDPIPAQQSASASQSAEGKSDQSGLGETGTRSETSLGPLLEQLASQGDTKGLATLEDIRITGAALNIYDDANAATWFAPRADLTFQKMPFGFRIQASADVATSEQPWNTEVSANYRRDTKKFEISSTIDNLVPARVAEKIFSLSQLAALSTPLSGHIDFVTDASGVIGTATGELQASSGKITLPDFFSEPIAVDEGSLRVSFVPQTGGLEIRNSSLIIGGRRVELSGAIDPIRDTNGRLSSLAIKLATRNTGAAGESNSDQKSLVDRIDFAGRASVTQARLDVDDLVILSANTGLRLRGNLVGGEQSPGIHLAGRVRDISADLLKSLWPPIVAPDARSWVNENVVNGRITEGTFQINLAENELTQARMTRIFPEGSIEFSAKLADVMTRYFKSLPALTDGNGSAEQRDNKFTLNISSASTALATGEKVIVKSGRFVLDQLLVEGSKGVFHFDLESSVPAMFAFATHPDINAVKKEAKPDFPNVKGTSHVKLDLAFPMIKNVPKEQVQMATTVEIKGVAIPDIAPGMDLDEGDFTIDLKPDTIDISGPAKINGLPVQISWRKPKNGGEPIAKLRATLDDDAREKIGIKFSDYLTGPIKIEADIGNGTDGDAVFDVQADLSSAAMRLATLSWKRPPTPGTTASFKMKSNESGRSIQNFKLDGAGLRLRGAMELTTLGKLKAVSMSEIRLDEDNVFSARVIPGDGTIDLQVSGTNLDARPYIKTILAPPSKQESNAPGKGQDFTLRASFDKVIANRGEVISNVTASLRARGGRIAEATIEGSYPNGQKVTATVVPLPKGREMRVRSNDAGSTMRAANFYSKIAGGALDFYALIGNEEGSPLRNGNLVIQNFEVRNEAALAKLDERGTPQKSGPRAGGVSFSTLTFPFAADDKVIRFRNVSVRGPDMCATADGLIRKSDNALSASGTVVPACGLSRAFNDVPLFGDILSGGNRNEGVFGVTYSMTGTIAKPNIQVNPLSAIAPGIFRRLFDFNPKAPPKEAEQQN